MEKKFYRLAERQHGVVARDQLLGLSVGAGRIRHALRRGDLVRIARGVYRIAGTPKTWNQTVVAAWLHGTGRTHTPVVALRTAAAIHGLHGFSATGRPVLMTARPGSVRNPLATVVTTSELPDEDIVVHEATKLRLTSIERTVFDLAMTAASAKVLDRLLDRSLLDRRVDMGALWVRLLSVQGRGRTGAPQLRAALEARSGEYVPAESELEHLAIDALARAGLPKPRRQHPLPGAPVGRVDLCFPDALLIVELDGGLHRLPESRRSDYERDIAAAREGWLVVRFEWFHVRFRPAWFAASVADIRQQRRRTVQAA